MPSTTPYADILHGLQDVVLTVTDIKAVLLYEPSAIQVTPTAYILLDRYARNQRGQITATRPRFMVRLCVPVPTSEDEEIAAVELAFAIADAVDADSQFTGAIVAGMAQSPDGIAGWVRIGGTLYRALDVFVECVVKGAYAGAL